jgi:hypothetical protein
MHADAINDAFGACEIDVLENVGGLRCRGNNLMVAWDAGSVDTRCWNKNSFPFITMKNEMSTFLLVHENFGGCETGLTCFDIDDV